MAAKFLDMNFRIWEIPGQALSMKLRFAFDFRFLSLDSVFDGIVRDSQRQVPGRN